MSEKEEATVVEEITPETKTQQTGFVWTPEIIKALKNFLKDIVGEDLVDKYFNYKKNEAEADRKLFEAMSKHNLLLVFILTVFLSVIVVGMSWLALSGHVSGDALLFLIGTITGYILLFIQRLVAPAMATPPTEKKSIVEL